MSRVFEALEQRNRRFWIIIGVTSISSLGAIDYLTGFEVSVSLFYLGPIAAVAWFGSRRLGLSMAVLSGITWLVAEIAAGQSYSQPIIYFWNTLIRYGFFMTVTYLVAELRTAHETQRSLARTDHVSGAVSALHFKELAQLELDRLRRAQQPLTVAYIDLDNFKLVNDRFGHDTGDELIRFVCSELKAHLRSIDVVARLGGDEFALLLPATGQGEAQAVIARLHTGLTESIRQKNLLVTFSIGVVTCVTAPDSVRELIRLADELMYSVKHSTKNDVRFSTYIGR